MRPIAIVLQAFGSFPERVEIDFSQLAPRGLFLVTGDTGSGKTTIFDAMTYALYGETPRRAGKEEVRSHHAELGVETFVEFTFESDGCRYLARRTPDQPRPAKRGGGITEAKGTASLVRIDGGGTTPLATKVAEVRARATEIVGLEPDQFQRVILLPQGEVARFLLASSREREDLLGHLFGGAVFDAIIEQAKKREHGLRVEVGDADTRIAYELRSAREQVEALLGALGVEAAVPVAELDREELGRLLDDVEAAVLDRAARVREAGARAQAAAQASEAARAGAERFDQALRLREELDALAAVEATIVQAEAAARTSSLARSVAQAAAKVAEAERAHERARAIRDERVRQIRSALAPVLGEVEVLSEAAALKCVDEVRLRLAQMEERLDRHVAAQQSVAAKLAEIEQLHSESARVATAMQQQAARRAAIARELPEARARAIDVNALDRQIEEAGERSRLRASLEGHRSELEQAHSAELEATRHYEEVFRRFIATAAPRLAADLRGGEPCPVCGSVEHPQPAGADGSRAVSFEEVDAAAAVRSAASLRLQEIGREVARVRGRLGDDADAAAEELREREAALQRQREEATAAHRRSEALAAEDRQLEESERALAVQLAGIETSLAAADKAKGELEGVAAAAALAADGVDAQTVARLREIVAAAEVPCRDLGQAFDGASAASGAELEAANNLCAALEGSPFASVEAATAVLLPFDVEAAQLQAAREHRESMSAARAGLETLERQGIPAERPDVLRAQGEADAAATEAASLQSVYTTAANALDHARRALAAHDALVEASGSLRQAHALATRVFKVLSTGGALNMPLRRWVLATELDRVSAAANVHLQRMTGSRYSLRRRQEIVDGRRAFGLDLEVTDAHTGRARSTSSLSGGEQFQASLALALGLADVVSHGGAASGKRFEALFIDEGFGSLDPTALQEAIGALHQLHATGRMVGAITHVEAMKQDLHVGIEIVRRPDGGGSTVRVYP